MLNRSQFGTLTLGFLLLGLVYQVQHTINIYLLPISDDLSAGRTAISAVFGSMIFFRALGDATAGFLSERFGPVRVVRVGGFVLGAGLIASSQSTRSWHLFLAFSIIVGLGIALSGWIPVTTMVRQQSHGQISVTMGFMTTGVGVSLLVAAPLLQKSILHIGWRMTMLVDGFILLMGIQVIALLLAYRNRSSAPQETEVKRGDGNPRNSIRTIRTQQFWITFSAFFAFSMAFQLLMAHQVAYLIDVGWDPLITASGVGIMGLLSIGMKPALGIGANRLGRQTMFTVGVANLVGAALLLINLENKTGWRTGIYLYTVLLSVAYSMIPVVYTSITADRFRKSEFGAIFGALTTASGIGASLGVFGGGVIFDWSGDYKAGFAIAAILALVAGILVWMRGPGGNESTFQDFHP